MTTLTFQPNKTTPPGVTTTTLYNQALAPYTPKSGKLVFGHYVLAIPTYGSDPVSGQSQSVTAAETVLRESKALGVDALALNFAGVDNGYPGSIANFLTAAANVGGIKVFLNPDTTGSLTAQNISDLLVQYGHAPGYLQYRGRPFLSTYGGAYHQTWADVRTYWSGILAAARAGGVNPFFVPDFCITDSAGNYLDNATSTQADAAVTNLYLGLCDGGFQFLGGQVSQVALSVSLHKAGLTSMGCVCPQYWQSKAAGRNYFDSMGAEGLRDSFESCIGVQNCEMIEIITNNDFDEASNYTDADTPKYWPYLFNNATPFFYKRKLGTQAVLKYYIQKFKMGASPVITTDFMAYFYRTQPKALVASNDPAGPIGEIDTALDDIFFFCALTAPATLTVLSGSNSPATVSVPAGVSFQRVPFVPGSQEFTLTRNGVQLLSVIAEPVVSSAVVYNANYTTGFLTR